MANDMEIDVENFDKIAEDLELKEIMNGGVLTQVEYAKLMAIYFYQNDLINAKFLWKRIPAIMKETVPQMAAVWKVGVSMLKKEYSQTYANLKYNWSADLEPVMRQVEDRFKRDALQLVKCVYPSLTHAKLAVYLGCELSQIPEIAHQNSWISDEEWVYIPKEKEQINIDRNDYTTFEKMSKCASYLDD